jgi:hypothetical protein
MLNGMLSSFRPSKGLAEAPELTSEAFSILVSTEAFMALAEMLADVRDRVEAARRNRI